MPSRALTLVDIRIAQTRGLIDHQRQIIQHLRKGSHEHDVPQRTLEGSLEVLQGRRDTIRKQMRRAIATSRGRH